MNKILCASIVLPYFEKSTNVCTSCVFRLCHLGSTALDGTIRRTSPGTVVAITSIVANTVHLPGLADELLPFPVSTGVVALEGREGIATIPAQAACGGSHSAESCRG